MPESKGRDKASYTPPQEARTTKIAPSSPPWFAPVMLTLMVVGLFWVVIFYVTKQEYPIPAIGRWNLAAGFGLMMAGFMMTTRWK